jgi:hypothetical protein
MSEYQYYEFLALDRTLSKENQAALRDISSRAEISAHSLINTYQWGSFKARPLDMMVKWFDLHLYVANWGEHKLMLRFPKAHVDLPKIRSMVSEVDTVEVSVNDTHAIVSIALGNDEFLEDEFWQYEKGWSSHVVQLRSDVLHGDLRLFYIVWLMAVQDGLIADNAKEPLPGLGPLTPDHEAFATFFEVDAHLLVAAAEKSNAAREPVSEAALQAALKALPEARKNAFLQRFLDKDPFAEIDLRKQLQPTQEATSGLRTVGFLRERADIVRHEHEQAQAAAAAKVKRALEEQLARAQRTRLDALVKKGDAVWLELEREIDKKLPAAYQNAYKNLKDLDFLAEEQKTTEAFQKRLRVLHTHHRRKYGFIKEIQPLLLKHKIF